MSRRNPKKTKNLYRRCYKIVLLKVLDDCDRDKLVFFFNRERINFKKGDFDIINVEFGVYELENLLVNKSANSSYSYKR
jgi:hypothetical protein